MRSRKQHCVFNRGGEYTLCASSCFSMSHSDILWSPFSWSLAKYLNNCRCLILLVYLFNTNLRAYLVDHTLDQRIHKFFFPFSCFFVGVWVTFSRFCGFHAFWECTALIAHFLYGVYCLLKRSPKCCHIWSSSILLRNRGIFNTQAHSVALYFVMRMRWCTCKLVTLLVAHICLINSHIKVKPESKAPIFHFSTFPKLPFGNAYDVGVTPWLLFTSFEMCLLSERIAQAHMWTRPAVFPSVSKRAYAWKYSSNLFTNAPLDVIPDVVVKSCFSNVCVSWLLLKSGSGLQWLEVRLI